MEINSLNIYAIKSLSFEASPLKCLKAFDNELFNTLDASCCNRWMGMSTNFIYWTGNMLWYSLHIFCKHIKRVNGSNIEIFIGSFYSTNHYKRVFTSIESRKSFISMVLQAQSCGYISNDTPYFQQTIQVD